MSERPPAESLVPVMLDPIKLQAGRLKLSDYARGIRLAEARCPKDRHLLAATFRHPHGNWVLARSALMDRGWACHWWDAIADPAAMRVWCRCNGWAMDCPTPPTRGGMRYDHRSRRKPRPDGPNPGEVKAGRDRP